MDTSAIKAINELTAAIKKNAEQIRQSDPKNLRNRMRKEMLNYLENSLSKENPS